MLEGTPLSPTTQFEVNLLEPITHLWQTNVESHGRKKMEGFEKIGNWGDEQLKCTL